MWWTCLVVHQRRVVHQHHHRSRQRPSLVGRPEWFGIRWIKWNFQLWSYALCQQTNLLPEPPDWKNLSGLTNIHKQLFVGKMFLWQYNFFVEDHWDSVFPSSTHTLVLLHSARSKQVRGLSRGSHEDLGDAECIVISRETSQVHYGTTGWKICCGLICLFIFMAFWYCFFDFWVCVFHDYSWWFCFVFYLIFPWGFMIQLDSR